LLTSLWLAKRAGAALAIVPGADSVVVASAASLVAMTEPAPHHSPGELEAKETTLPCRLAA